MSVRPSASVTVAVVFFLLEVALARTPSTLFGNEVAVCDSFLVSDVHSVLRLPSETVKDGSHSHPDHSLGERVILDIESAEPITATSVLLTVLRFHDLRPVNRHFPLRSSHDEGDMSVQKAKSNDGPRWRSDDSSDDDEHRNPEVIATHTKNRRGFRRGRLSHR